WNLVGLEAQLPRPYDFITTSIGRTPVIVSRDGAGRVHANVNSCRHKGALVCHRERGSARTFVCQYHGWAYDASGRNVHIKGKDEGAYPEAFDALEHDLQPVARLGTYRGFIFASLSPDVPALEDYLGDFRRFIDLV